MKRNIKKSYKTLEEASAAAKCLGFKSGADYQAGRKVDPLLPSCPASKYVDDWRGWVAFLGTGKICYEDVEAASKAAIFLGIKTKVEYQSRYGEDPKLPRMPEKKYFNDWTGWRLFLGRLKEPFYPTLEEASEAVRKLGLTSLYQYRLEKAKDPRLPANPWEFYKSNWVDAKTFFGKKTFDFYVDLASAADAAIKLGFNTAQEYQHGRKKDSKLPARPDITYLEEWSGWGRFLGKRSVESYPHLEEAAAAAKALGVKTMVEYRERRHLDPRLPGCPEKFYPNEWAGVQNFLGRPDIVFYETINEASLAASKLGITTMMGYKKLYRQDERLPSVPQKIYSTNWTGFPDFLAGSKSHYYATLEECSAAAVALEILDPEDYNYKRNLDSRLPPSPDKFYITWVNWTDFLGGKRKDFYQTLSMARDAVLSLEFQNMAQYRSERRSDPRLPAKPHVFYKDEWLGSAYFFGNEPKIYPTLAEAMRAVEKLKIFTSKEYKSRRRLDSKLPANPDVKYKNEWTGWANFLCDAKGVFYLTLDEACAAVKRLGIRSKKDYALERHKDPQLPSDPYKFYRSEWKNNAYFYGEIEGRFYPTMEEASEAAQLLGFSSAATYKSGCHKDPRLPVNPERTYAKNWQGMPSFLGLKPKSYYSTIEEASLAVNRLGCSSMVEYKTLRFKDPLLPAVPEKFYGASWTGVERFLLPKSYHSLEEIKRAVKILGLKDSVDYKNNYKSYPPLPAHPERKFKSDWTDWYDLCDISRPYAYDEAVTLIAQESLSTRREYIDYIIETGNQRLSRVPDRLYKNHWINWHVYLGTREPYRVKNIRPPYSRWAECINEFLKKARGGRTKESHLCRFVRYYIQAFEMGKSPEEFLTSEKKDIRPFKEWLESNETKNIAYKTVTSVNEFLDFIIREHLTDEDEETGELVLLKNTYNPFSNITVDVSSEKNSQPNETVKYALAYQYVNAAKEWIVPPSARNFSDLTHLHTFNADWFDVDSQKIDFDDPNCVLRRFNDKLQIWFPAFWMHTYALMSVPARGRQIAYCDSGEADDMIPIISDSRTFEWEKNSSTLAGLTKNQSFVKHYDGGQLGMYFTSNKTSSNGGGYAVPWIPENLAYWMIQLRDWQAKYNTIFRPMPWLECERTSLNEMQRIAKGSNCFLFRDFGAEEPGSFSGRLALRLSAALYHTQPKDLELASVSKDEAVLSHYSSRYTPHSMRVSLITAYVEEFALPLPIIMKVAGHSSIVMTIYYCKINSEDLRRRFSEGEKRLCRKSHTLPSV